MYHERHETGILKKTLQGTKDFGNVKTFNIFSDEKNVSGKMRIQQCSKASFVRLDLDSVTSNFRAI